ncbi:MULTISPECIES: 6-phosphogluconolactonase [Pseudescherichia]|uniref:6-phosphogluconolactonase n=1 Tax=Pseudescherichia TaxID=2055880 RepID=UPI001EDD3076|nr:MULTISPECIES: 6-phosphogluconolactonase [Pseudescherichia]
MQQTVYTASPESQQIHVWRLNDEGTLTLVQVVDVPGQVQPMVVSPDKRFLYVGVRPEFRVLAYRIAPEDGALTFTAEAPLSGSPTHISTDRQGRFLFTASYNAGSVSVTPLNDGLPGEITALVEGLDGCHSANISPDNATLWVPALKQDRICLFTLGDNGQLTAQTPAEVTTVEGAGPRHMAFHPNQQYAYCVNELNGSVDVWQLSNAHGQIECVQTLDMMPADFADTRWAADIHITPDGRHLYACDRTASIVTIFSVSEDGSVLAVEGYQPTETQPRGFNIDHSGKYLIAAGQKSHHIALYAIQGAQGLLEEKGRYAVGQGPMWVVVHAH